ncbi:hypothetical protein ACFOUP_14190 [Belliella kenyensis]|uniref:Lipoprotein n=1 Tax=Belliella kenyensis TaxID=1472724 RepID=A0ABV8EMK4_9BACT|nr:hypothetical protein [Belliella kenyensis]MCH7401594.1 hypothetical protein [Belliella kenyensis]MDN3603126.1 hypothetical protein [Belliella kenyensis]
MRQILKKISFYLLCFFLISTISSCEDRLRSELMVYSNNFGQLDLTNFDNSRLFIFQNDTIMGAYHNEEVWVKIPDLPPHNAVKVTIEVLAHDSWDGNVDDGVSGPDFWYYKLDDQEVYRTTFSNTVCESTYCLRQSYPDQFFKQNFPKQGAVQTNLPGLCLLANQPNGTTRYAITKIYPHSQRELKITMGDELMQTNAPVPQCDESWSIAKIEVSVLDIR